MRLAYRSRHRERVYLSINLRTKKLTQTSNSENRSRCLGIYSNTKFAALARLLFTYDDDLNIAKIIEFSRGESTRASSRVIKLKRMKIACNDITLNTE